jgi:hypothetical protein
MVTNKLLLFSGFCFGILHISILSSIPPYFSILLFFQTIATILFWSNPIENKNKLIHQIDGVLTKIHILSFILYKLFIYQNNLLLFSISTIIGLYFFYLSHINSSKKWCSKKHLLYHSFAHIFSIMSIYLAVI